MKCALTEKTGHMCPVCSAYVREYTCVVRTYSCIRVLLPTCGVVCPRMMILLTSPPPLHAPGVRDFKELL